MKLRSTAGRSGVPCRRAGGGLGEGGRAGSVETAKRRTDQVVFDCGSQPDQNRFVVVVIIIQRAAGLAERPRTLQAGWRGRSSASTHTSE